MSVGSFARTLGITRICHFTPASNLGQILVSGQVQGTQQLKAGGAAFKATDDRRLDGNLSAVCCSIEYPNGWYLNTAQGKDANFLDWVVLTFPVDILDIDGTKFYPSNAARGYGGAGAVGQAGLEALFAPVVVGKARYIRTVGHPDWWPTDDQAEVHIPGPIPLSRAISLIFPSEDHARREIARHALLQPPYPLPPIRVAPTLFTGYQLSTMIRRGQRPPESLIP